MIVPVKHFQHGKQLETLIESDEIGVLFIGMNKKNLNQLSPSVLNKLRQAQDELLISIYDNEIPIIIYGESSKEFEKKLKKNYLYEKIKEDSKYNINLHSVFDKYQINNIVITGTTVAPINDFLISIAKNINEIISSEKLIAMPENDKKGAKTQLDWLENNGIFYHNNDELISLLYTKSDQ
jgi:hypothetical protein